MPFDEQYRRQVALLIRVIPYVADEKSLALKGGTAINLFVRDIPRLSVDIDLTYVPIAPRSDSLDAIDGAMRRIAANVRKDIPHARVSETPLQREGTVTKLIIRVEGAQIKVEVTPVLRGCLHEPETHAVSAMVEDTFGFAEAQLVSRPDLYGGKIVAALDRQHPRDLFDVRAFLVNEGIDTRLRVAFIVYLLSHNRPMHEVLGAAAKDITQEYARGFQGMTDETVHIEELVEARERLIDVIVGEMPEDHHRFLLSFELGTPEWPLLGVEGVASLPAVRWRQRNLDKLAETERAALVASLENVIGW